MIYSPKRKESIGAKIFPYPTKDQHNRKMILLLKIPGNHQVLIRNTVEIV